MTNTHLPTLIRNARRNLDLSQAKLGEALGKSRWWVIQLEKGETYTGGKEIELDPMMCLKLADVLNLNPTDVLFTAGVPKTNWPNFSNMLSKSDTVRNIDITPLTHEQAKLITALVDELKRGNTNESNPT